MMLRCRVCGLPADQPVHAAHPGLSTHHFAPPLRACATCRQPARVDGLLRCDCCRANLCSIGCLEEHARAAHPWSARPPAPRVCTPAQI